MCIKLSSDEYKHFNLVINIDFNTNSHKIIINKDLILENDFTNNGEMAISGSIIFRGGKLINNGKIYLIEKEKIQYILDNDISGDFQYTGLQIKSDINDLSLIVKGPVNTSIDWESEFKFEIGKNSAFYFSNDGGLTPKSTIQSGDKLYWNESYSKLKLYKSWRIILEII